MNIARMVSKWLESMGQDPRTFPRDVLRFAIKFYVLTYIMLLPIWVVTYFVGPITPLPSAPGVKPKMPSQFWPFFALFGVYMWCAVAVIISLLGGWYKVARRFRAPRKFREGQLFKRQSGSVGGGGYGRILTVRVSPQGLYLACIFPFQIMHPPMLIPWEQIKAVRQKRFLWRTSSYLTVGSPKWLL
jgi:hypothetical protein